MTHPGVLSIVLVLFALGYLCVPTVAADETGNDKIREHYQNEQLAVDGFRAYELHYVDKLDTLRFAIEVRPDVHFDIYILVDTEYNRYVQNQSFDPELALEDRRVTLRDSWEQPDWKRYHLVVDNRNNSRAGEAVANTSLTFDITLGYPWPRTVEDIFNGYIGWDFIIGVILGMLYVAGIVYVYLEVEKHRRDTYPWVALALVCSPLALLAWRIIGIDQKPPPLKDDRCR